MALFVTDGEQRATLAVVRALGSAGIPVTVGSWQRTSLAGSSRYCMGKIVYPSPEADPVGFQAFLGQQLRESHYQALFPMTDITLQLVSQMRETMEHYVRLPIPDHTHVQEILDKRYILTKAQELGIAVPKTFGIKEEGSLEEVSRKVSYPAVIKPRFSRYYDDRGWRWGAVQYAFNAAELVAKYNQIHQQIPDPLVQERIRGEGRGVFLLMWEGELKAAFCHRRLREKPPWGGVSVYSESITLDEGLVKQSISLLKACDWQGVAMVEYKLDDRDGRAKLMEVNGRFWGSLQLAIDAGMNFPLILYRLATGERVAPQLSYKAGVRSRWLLGDLDNLWIRLSHPGIMNGASDRVDSRLRACLSFLRFYEPNLRYEVLRFDDPRPGWFECKTYLREALHSVSKRRQSPAA